MYGKNKTAPLSSDSLDESDPDYHAFLGFYSTQNGIILGYDYGIGYSSDYLFIGITEDGTFGLKHHLKVDSDLAGSNVISKCMVDGKETTFDELNGIVNKMRGDSGGAGTRWLSPVANYPFASEAQEGHRPSNIVDDIEAHSYPGDMVQQVEDTVEMLVGRIDGKDRAKNEDGSVEVTAREVTEIVEVPTFYTSLEESDGTEQATWGYLEITDGADDDVLFSINEVLRKEYEDVKRETTNLKSLATVVGECISYRSIMTCNRDGLLGVYVVQQCTNWGPHGWSEPFGHTFDLSSGKELEPWEVAGMSESELDDAAAEAIASYVMGNPSDIAYASESEAQSAAHGELEFGEYLLTNDGIVVSLPEYAMGYPYATGSLKIVVSAFEESSLVGTNVADQFVTGS